MTSLRLEKLLPVEPIPFGLLLLADETVAAIGKYLYTSDVYLARQEGEADPVAVIVLHTLGPAEMEIKNIAVATERQGQGIGSFLIHQIKEIAQRAGCRRLWVGTPDIAAQQVRFYEKNGFSKAGVKKDFFINNYPDPIFDGGVQLRDMAMLCAEL